MDEKGRLASLFESYGIGTKISQRDAAKRAGISRQTLSKILSPARTEDGLNVHQQRQPSLKKIADAFDIPWDLVKREAMADWGQVSTVDAETVDAVYAQLSEFHLDDLIKLNAHVVQIIADRASRQPTAHLPQRPDRRTVHRSE